MTTNLLGATVEIADDYSRGVNPPTITRAVIRAIEIPSAGVRLVVMREDGTLRTIEGTGTGDTKVRVVAEPPAP